MFERMKKKEYWKTVNLLFIKYKRLWNAPDIPIYIFPMNTGNALGRGSEKNKSGVSFDNKMFLFLSPIDDEKEIEALFVHEYHHVCRLNNMKKDNSDYTLLDSVVLEGLAENAVREYCGKEYCANWCDFYKNNQLEHFWGKLIKPNLNVNRKEAIHDRILNGQGGYPTLIGYAVGYYLVRKYLENNQLSIKSSFHIPAKKIIKNIN